MKTHNETRAAHLRGRLRQALGELDVERMSTTARRQYLRNRLREVDRMLEIAVYQHMQDMSSFSPWDMTEAESDFLEEVMDLNYLEASRQAIMQTLNDLNRAAFRSWPASDDPAEPVEGIDSSGFVGDC